MDKRILGWVAIGVAIIAVFYMSYRNNNGIPHGMGEEWLHKHKVIVERNGDPKRFCLKCHEKKGQTQENFCTPCHVKRGVKPAK